jgi:hypothetical protein
MRDIPPRSSRLVIALVLAFAPVAAWADDPIGQVKTETGTVTVERGDKIQSVAIGDHVFQSDAVVTAPDSSVGITFADNSMMSLGPPSRLKLDQFRFDSTTEEGVFNSSLQKGTLAVKSGLIVHQTPEAMHIKTPSALLGVRGTEFVVRAE